MTTLDLRAAVARLPRVRLAHLPTPLEEVPRFAAAIGDVRVFIKRDDCTGLLLGGNKARHNEFLLGDALERGCDTVVWGASVQSNNCRQTAAACAKLGLECRLYLNGEPPQSPQGNLLLDYLVGAKVEFTTARLGPELDSLLLEKAEAARREGRRPYVWDRPRVVPLAAASYTLCLAEIVEQMHALKLKTDAVYVSSAGSTGAGVVLGKKLLNSPFAVRLISPIVWPWKMADDLAHQANVAAEWMGLPQRLEPSEIDIDASYVPPGYGEASPEGRAAFKLLATTEGIVTDPVYSAKALAALIQDVKARKYPPGAVIVFIHTGGVPAIFADTAKVWP